MVDFLNVDDYRITFNRDFKDLGDLGNDLCKRVLSVHVAHDEVKEINDLGGYDVRISVDKNYDGPGTLYHVDIMQDGTLYTDIGVGIFERDVA